MFHGGEGNPAKMEGMTGFTEVADRHGFAVAYPVSIEHWNDGRNATAALSDDLGLTSALIPKESGQIAPPVTASRAYEAWHDGIGHYRRSP